jgi:hypothetical protein
MAWPFDEPEAPTYDSGIVAVSTTPATVLTTASVYMFGMDFVNTTAADITVNVTNTAGAEALDDQVVPAHGRFAYSDPNLKLLVGIKWDASAAGVKGHIWGW